jgi:hypothetical protein
MQHKDDAVDDLVKETEQEEHQDIQWLRAPPRQGEIILQIGDSVKRESLEQIVKDLHKKIDDLMFKTVVGGACPDLTDCTPPYQCGKLGRCQPVVKTECFIDVRCRIADPPP